MWPVWLDPRGKGIFYSPRLQRALCSAAACGGCLLVLVSLEKWPRYPDARSQGATYFCFVLLVLIRVRQYQSVTVDFNCKCSEIAINRRFGLHFKGADKQ